MHMWLVGSWASLELQDSTTMAGVLFVEVYRD